MKLAKRVAAAALLMFVAVTVGVLIVQEVSHSEAVAQEDAVPSTEEIAEGEEQVAALASVDPIADAHPPARADMERSAEDVEEAPITESWEDAEASALPETSLSAEGSSEPSCVVDAIYFHNTARCWTCKKIEATAKEQIEATFPQELAEGRLRWSAINMEGQTHYVEQYELVKPTLILVRSIDGQQQDSTALDEAWNLIRQEPRFAAYIVDATREFLGECR